MMKTLLISLLVLTTQTAFAHIEKGTWIGKTDKGLQCTMLAIETYHDGGMDHPLTERVRVRIGNDEVVLSHPPVVSAATAMAFFNHDVLQAVIPTTTGARAIVVDMHHEPGKDGGPVAFHVIDHIWKNDVRSAVHCENIVHQGYRNH